MNPTFCNTIVSADNAIVSTDNAIVSTDNAIVSTDNAIVSTYNVIVSTYNAIAASACKNRKTLFPPAPSKNCGLNDKSLTGHDITAYLAHKTRSPRLIPEVKMGLKAASNETELPIDTFPVECPYSIGQILDGEFLPDAIDS